MAKSGKKSLKYYIGKLHLWLGFATGLVVFVVAVTGCIYTFREEIETLFDDYTSVEVEQGEFLPPSEVRNIAQSELPGRTIHGIAYGDKSDALKVVFYEPDPEFYQMLYLNPYSGELIKQVNVLEGFFYFILDGHMHLWMGDFGNKIIGFSTLIFLFILISGLILWFPKNRKAAGKRVRFKWSDRTSRKRKNYDLHNILGFYASLIAVIIAITGLVMTFNWFQDGFYAATGGDKAHAGFEYPLNSNSAKASMPETEEDPIDIIWRRLMAEYPDAYEVEMHIPPSDDYTIYAHMSFSSGTYWDADYRYFDSRTLEEVRADSPYGRLEEASVADMIRRMNYDIHVGAIGGIAGKIIVFISALIVGSLPVTGFMIWWGRRNGKRSEKNTRSKTPLKRDTSHKRHRKPERTVRPKVAEPVEA